MADARAADTTDMAVDQQSAMADMIEAMNGDPNFMTSLARGLLVLRAFSDSQSAMTLSEVSQKTGLARASVRRCLYTLEKLGFVASEGRNFVPQPALLTLAHAYLSARSFPVAAQPVLERIRDELGESCSLGVLDGHELVYVARAEKTRIISIALSVGSRLPAYCTSMGRVLLAHVPEEQLSAYLARTPLRRHTDYTVIDRCMLRKRLADTRVDGFAINDQELELGLRSIAVPVRDRHGKVVAALNIEAGTANASVDKLRHCFLPVLLAGAQELSAIAR